MFVLGTNTVHTDVWNIRVGCPVNPPLYTRLMVDALMPNQFPLTKMLAPPAVGSDPVTVLTEPASAQHNNT